MSLRTPLCATIGIDVPVFQAGMGFVALADLAAAVSRAGGLGVLGAGSMRGEALRQEIRKLRSQTGSPFGIDILMPRETVKMSDDVRRELEKIDPAIRNAAATRVYADPDIVQEQLEVIFDERPAVLASGLGVPPAEVVSEAMARGIHVACLVGTVRAAEEAVNTGADIVIAQGTEGGGHTSRVSTLALVPQIVDRVGGRAAVVAAGGIGDGRALIAALALGAEAVWMGTRFVATVESAAHPAYKARLVAASEDETTITRAYTGKPARVIHNKWTKAWQDREAEIRFPFQGLVAGQRVAAGFLDGEIEEGAIFAGQVCGAIHDIPAAGEIVRTLELEANAALARLNSLVADEGAKHQRVMMS